MALEIAIEELGTDGDKVAYVTLPANKTRSLTRWTERRSMEKHF